VKHAEQPVTVGLLSTNDPLFGLQYNLQRISAEQAWQVTTGQPSVRLAIIDIYGQGALNDHPDLTGRFAPGFGTGGAAQHAFLVTGVAGAATNNNIGIASLAHNVSLIDYHLNVYGQSDTYLAGLINEAANPALGNADVINFSFLTLKYKLTPSGDLRWCPHDFDNVSIAIDNAIGQGVVCVAAVGNQTSLYPGCELTIPFQAYPAGYAGVIAVSASDFDDNFYDPFNYWETSVAAPGVGIWTTNPAAEGGYSSEDGTSFSSPQVAGLAALILSVNPSLSAETVREYICRTADKVGQYPYDQNLAFGTYNNRMGYGRINAYKALSLANGDPRVPQSFSASVHYTQYNAHPKISWVRAPLHPQDVDVEQYEIWRRVISNPNPYLNPPWSLLTTIGNTPTDYIDFSIQWAGSGPNTARYRIKAVDAAGLKSPFTDSVGVNFGNAFKLIIEGRETPSELTLEQNYPNPFNPSTTIDFVIPSDGRVSLKVFNVLGQEVNTLIDENKSQGRHSMKLDATGLPSGLYFYRLQHNGNTLNGKMLLAK
jgi:subtilisin family serine protease